jgi:hypothetical protein
MVERRLVLGRPRSVVRLVETELQPVAVNRTAARVAGPSRASHVTAFDAFEWVSLRHACPVPRDSTSSVSAGRRVGKPGAGYMRIRGALLSLGHDLSSSTIASIHIADRPHMLPDHLDHHETRNKIAVAGYRTMFLDQFTPVSEFPATNAACGRPPLCEPPPTDLPQRDRHEAAAMPSPRISAPSRPPCRSNLLIRPCVCCKQARHLAERIRGAL